MIRALPIRALLQFELTIPHIARLPRADGDMRKWSVEHMIPPLIQLEGDEPFADVYWGWNQDGLAVAFDVPQRRTPLQCDPRHWWQKDGLRICIDTRDTRDNRRGTRFSHFFYVLPRTDGRANRPVAGLHRMSRAKEHPPEIDPSQIDLAVRTGRSGYAVEVVIPAACLHGWDPAGQPRIGFFYKINDVQFGAQTLSATDELGWNVDPSTWASAVMAPPRRSQASKPRSRSR